MYRYKDLCISDSCKPDLEDIHYFERIQVDTLEDFQRIPADKSKLPVHLFHDIDCSVHMEMVYKGLC